MKRVGKPVFFLVAAVILFLTYTSIFGIHVQNGDNTETYLKGAGDIRWGIDIRGGVEATFVPDMEGDATDEQMDSAEATITQRLVGNNITDYELYKDYDNDRLIVRFPWRSDEADFDPEEAINELSATALLTFRPGAEYETQETAEDGSVIYRTPAGKTAETVILQGDDVTNARAVERRDEYTNQAVYEVELTFSESGREKFSAATAEMVGQTISVWMDDVMISSPVVNEAITTDTCVITGSGAGFTPEEATDLANKIRAGALPFQLRTTNFQTVSPTLGESSLNAMTLAGVVAFALVAVFMILVFRLTGVVAVIALLGQVAVSFIAVSGYLPFFNSFTMTLPGIAGMILSIGMGVDANIITATRIKEELWAGKTLDGAIVRGDENSFWAIFDGNITLIIVSLILLGVFGPSNILSMLFGASTTGSIYSFGYTLLVGNIGNFVMGVGASRLMTKSLSSSRCLRKKWLYGGPAE